MIKTIKSCVICQKKHKGKYYHCWDDNNEVAHICKYCVDSGKLKEFGLRLASMSSYAFQKVKDLIN